MLNDLMYRRNNDEQADFRQTSYRGRYHNNVEIYNAKQ